MFTSSVQTDKAIREDLARFAAPLKRISINWRPDGIFASAYLETNHAAVDEWMDFQRFLNGHFASGVIIRQLLDSRAGIAPVAYTVQSSNKAISESPNGPTHWVAVITSKRDNSLMQAGMSLMNCLRSRIKLRNFGAEQYDEAITWLLSINNRSK